MKAKILRTDAELDIIEQYMDQVGVKAEVVTTKSTDADALASLAGDIDLILTCYTEIPAKVIEAAPRLKGIVKYGVGTNNIDLEAASRNGVMVANCPDYGSDTVADHAFALMISLARRLTEIDRAMRSKAWVWPGPEWFGHDLGGKTMGLIGLGRIGRAMARRCRGFGMDLIASDPYVDESEAAEQGVRLTDLDELLAAADFVSIHCVLTPQTRGLLGERQLKRMKKTAFLIDVSRGAIIDETAVIRALKEGWIAGAGFDVFIDEPLGADYPLLGMDNVILTPHLAWYTGEAFQRVEKDTFDGVMDLLDGKVPKFLKNTDLLK